MGTGVAGARPRGPGLMQMGGRVGQGEQIQRTQRSPRGTNPSPSLWPPHRCPKPPNDPHVWLQSWRSPRGCRHHPGHQCLPPAPHTASGPRCRCWHWLERERGAGGRSERGECHSSWWRMSLGCTQASWHLAAIVPRKCHVCVRTQWVKVWFCSSSPSLSLLRDLGGP